MGVSEQQIPLKKICKRYGIADVEELEAALNALAYLMLHMAKVKASEDEYKLIYEQSGLNPSPHFAKAMFDVVFPNINDIRAILASENNQDGVRFLDLDWRLSLVTSCRSR